MNALKFKLILLMLLMGFTATTTSAYQFEKNGIYYNTLIDGESVVVTYKESGSPSYSGAVNIPSKVTYNGTTYTVIWIGGGAFRDCTGLTSVSIPNSVTEILGGAFYGCTGLTSVTIPESVINIAWNSFQGCTGLTSVVFNAKNCKGLGEWLKDATNLSSFAIGEGVESIPANLCLNLTGISSVNIPNSVTTIGNSAFSGCTGLRSVSIGNSVTSIGWDAFCDCTGLKSVTIP